MAQLSQLPQLHRPNLFSKFLIIATTTFAAICSSSNKNRHFIATAFSTVPTAPVASNTSPLAPSLAPSFPFRKRSHRSRPFYHSMSSPSKVSAPANNDNKDNKDNKGNKDDGTTRNIVVIGGGIQGTSTAFHLHRSLSQTTTTTTTTTTTATTAPAPSTPTTITILEPISLASAASGKGGGFMARSWGDGTVTQRLHELAFDLYEELCDENFLNVGSYRKLPVLSVGPGSDPTKKAHKGNEGNKGSSSGRSGRSGGNPVKEKNPALADVIPNWLDGSVGRVSPMGFGEDTAQVTPKDFVEKMMEYINKTSANGEGPGVNVVLGKCVGIDFEMSEDAEDAGELNVKVVTGVRYIPTDAESGDTGEELVLPASDVIVAAGPWSCQAEQWFEGAVQLPMEGVKSTSIVWKPPVDEEGNVKVDAVDATALFCGEDHRFGTHLEVYPRPDGTIYICGIGGSDYITTSELQSSAFLTTCPPKDSRITAATSAFQLMSQTYATHGELSHAQACMRPCPPDAIPYMGKVPGFKGGYLNAGHNCWGIAWAPACGKAMAELVLGGRCECVDLGPFDPGRFTKSRGRGGRGRKKGSVSVGEQW